LLNSVIDQVSLGGRDARALTWVNVSVGQRCEVALRKESGFGRETHKMMLDHYQQTKNLLVSYSNKALGFF
jgi:aldehyde dehydrogenase